VKDLATFRRFLALVASRPTSRSCTGDRFSSSGEGRTCPAMRSNIFNNHHFEDSPPIKTSSPPRWPLPSESLGRKICYRTWMPLLVETMR
jgi:hypothetical protein